MNINTRWVRLGMSLVGVAGVGITSVLSVKCHDKAREKKEKKDKFIAYAPAIASGVLTSACILGSHHLSSKQIAALTASCGYLAVNRQKILERVRKEIGEEKTRQLQAEATKEVRMEKAKKEKKKPIIEETGHGHEHFMEDVFFREFYCSVEHFEWVKKMLNHMFMQGQHVNYNTFYELLGLSKTKEGYEFEWPGDLYGFSIDEPIYWERIPSVDENGERMWVVSCRTAPPITGYLFGKEE